MAEAELLDRAEIEELVRRSIDVGRIFRRGFPCAVCKKQVYYVQTRFAPDDYMWWVVCDCGTASTTKTTEELIEDSSMVGDDVPVEIK